MNRLSRLTEHSRDCLINAFECFSGEYDSIINELIQEKLQIRSLTKPEGMFRLSITENRIWLHLIRNRIQHDTDFDDFLDLLFKIAHEALQIVLKQVREFIAVDVKHRVDGAFERLRLKLDAGLDRDSYVVLNSAIADVVPEVQAAVDRVSAWFISDETPQGSAVRTLDQIVDIGIEATRRARQGFSPVVDKHVDDVGIFTTSALSEFTDILFTILDNVYVHSGISETPRVKVYVKTHAGEREEEEKIVIRVENEIAKGVYNLDNEQELSRIRDQMNSGAYKQRVNLEGGTGLLKLKRLVSANRSQALEFGYLENDAFFVELRLIVVTFSN